VDEFLGMAVAFLHLSPELFFEMRICHFMVSLDAWMMHEREKQRFDAELYRLQTADLINIQLKKSDRIKPEKLWHFPWDDEVEQVIMTDDEIKQMHEEIMKKFE
jgi:hypothetical protein